MAIFMAGEGYFVDAIDLLEADIWRDL